MIKFFFDAMYYQFFIYNRDKFKLEDPHERTILLFCGILFLPIIALIYPLIKENFNYDLPFIFFVPIFYILYYFLRACLNFVQQHSYCSKFHHLLCRIEREFVVSAEPPIIIKPGKSSFHNPSLAYWLKAI